MDNGSWSVKLLPTTPRYIIDGEIAISNRLFSTFVVTPSHVDITADRLSTSQILPLSRFTGVYLDQDDDGYTIGGDGLAWWLGDENNGDMFTTANAVTTASNFAVRLQSQVLDFANGLSIGSNVNATTGTITLAFESGQTRRQTLDTLCAAYGYEWRINPTGTVDGNTAALLYDSNHILFTEGGGRDGTVQGLAADLSVDKVTGRNYRTKIEVDWNDGVANGSATNTPSVTWNNFSNATPVLTSLVNSKPKGTKSAPQGVDKIVAWIIQNDKRADQVARRVADRAAIHEYSITVQIDEYDPWRFYRVGDYVYVHDLQRGIFDASHEVYHRGSTLHPLQLRAMSHTTPIAEGMGVYLIRHDASGAGAVTIFDLTPYVKFEETTTAIELSTNVRYHARNATSTRINRNKATRIAQQISRAQRRGGGGSGPPAAGQSDR